ncbi:MAG: TetR/AcrR family transcriptional regulator C-terminal domain-containing protein [Clostridia bacterium]|nr:TetR/AcrR family transcriptional regulator C-terminal domain-containing protein [Clostridia bacterium]
MKQRELSYNTKAALAAALRDRLKREPLNRVSVKELSEDCEINRQTFYYHFADIYELIFWAFREDMKTLTERQNSVLIWQDGFYLVFDYLNKNRDVALNVYRSVGHELFRDLIHENVYSILRDTVAQDFSEIALPDGMIDFYTSYCIISLTGLVENWLTGKLNYAPDEIIDKTESIINAQIEGAKAIYGKK